MKTITFVIHGKLQSSKLAQQLKEYFTADFKVELLFSEQAYHSIELAKNAVAQGTDYLIIVGGDGTLNEVVNGYMQSPEEKRKRVILGLIPAGSGNDFAKTIGIENDLQALRKYIKEEKYIDLDLGLMRFKNPDGLPGHRYFINIADIGIGGLVAQILSDAPRFLGPNTRYFLSIVRGFLKFKHQEVRLTYDGGEWEGRVLSLCMANGIWFGSGMGIAPQANPTDSKMQLVLLGNVKMLDYLKYLSDIKKAKNITHPEVQYLESSKCKIEVLGKPCPIDMDGEFVGFAPVEMETVTGELKFLGDKKFG